MANGFQVNKPSTNNFSSVPDGVYCLYNNNMGIVTQDLGVDVDTGDVIDVIFHCGQGKAGTTYTGGIIDSYINVGAESSPRFRSDTRSNQGFPADTWQTYTNTWTATDTGALIIEFRDNGGKGMLDAISVRRTQPTP